MRQFSVLLLFAVAITALAATPINSTQPAPAAIPSLKAFPIAVWLQDPRNAARYKAIGINLYVGLWQGPTAQQLSDLERAAMPVICPQNAEALKPRWAKEIVAWMQDDEPDNAQGLGEGKSYGPPITPEAILARYESLKTADPSRPVLLNLGQGVAWDGWVGRGVRTNKPEDYPLYARGGDLLSFDIYPVVHTHKDVAGKLEFVARGTERLINWTDNKKSVWACIECTHISNPDKRPTPAQVKSEIWLALTHGARGIIYFAHQFAPRFVEAGLLEDAEMARAVAQINREIQSLSAALLSTQPVEDSATASDSLAALTRRVDDILYVFTVGMTDANTTPSIKLKGITGPIEVLGESRTIQPHDGQWTDDFAGYQVHLYRINSPRK